MELHLVPCLHKLDEQRNIIMAKQFKLTVEKRDLKGNKDLRQLRQDMKIPGVYYSYDGSNILFQISNNEVKNAIQSGANIFTVNVGG